MERSKPKRELPPGAPRTSLTTAQVRMILRIYWTDRYQRRAQGMKRGTQGIRPRLAKQFGVSIEVIKKIVGLKHNDRSAGKTRKRFKTIALDSLQRSVKHRMKTRTTQ